MPTPAGMEDYKERVTYDGNGNILTYQRNGFGSNLAMDNLTYAYNTDGNGRIINNKLRHVSDAVTASNPYSDIKNGQAADNYVYDKIGNLIKDSSELINAITWNVYGKIVLNISLSSDPPFRK